MTGKTLGRYLAGPIFLILALTAVLGPSWSAHSQIAEGSEPSNELEQSFRAFLQDYRREMKRRNGSYLQSVHPKLPLDMHDFFFDVTLQMMQFSEQEGLEPTIDCQEFQVCKVIYPQPNNSWAAQQFILYENRWRWLGQ